MQKYTFLNVLQIFLVDKFYMCEAKSNRTTFFKERILGKTLTYDVLNLYPIFLEFQKLFFFFNTLIQHEGRVRCYFPLFKLTEYTTITHLMSIELHFAFFSELKDRGFFTNYMTGQAMNKFKNLTFLYKVLNNFFVAKKCAQFFFLCPDFKESIRNINIRGLQIKYLDALIIFYFNSVKFNFAPFKWDNVIYYCLSDFPNSDDIVKQFDFINICGDWTAKTVGFYILILSQFFEMFEINKIYRACTKFTQKTYTKISNTLLDSNKIESGLKKKILFFLWLQQNDNFKENNFLINYYYYFLVKTISNKYNGTKYI